MKDNRKQETIFSTSYLDKEVSKKTERAYLVVAVIVSGNSIVNAIVTNNILDIESTLVLVFIKNLQLFLRDMV